MINKSKKVIKKFLINKLLEKGLEIKLMTKKEKVVSLIDKLHPVKINKDLIRIGPNSDGGYLVPNDLEDLEACFSPGVDKVSEFELGCLNRGMNIFMADKSVEKPNLNIPEENYNFIKKYIGFFNNEDFVTMDNWVNSSNVSKEKDLLLQMDIEGAEYLSIINISDNLLNRFRVIVIEFHSLDMLWDEHFYDLANSVFCKLLQNHYCVHIHPNNCCGIETKLDVAIPRVAEFTFIRKDRVEKIGFNNSFPHKLDFDNTSKKQIILPDNWYKS